jgi:hypothetical protein
VATMTPPITTFRPFVPAKDLAESVQFYRRLGFTVERELSDGSGAILELGTSSFILQRFYVEEHAGNFMMQLVVPDLDQWWAHIESLQLADARPPRCSRGDCASLTSSIRPAHRGHALARDRSS